MNAGPSCSLYLRRSRLRLGVRHHGAELVYLEWTAAKTRAVLLEDDRTLAGQLDADGGNHHDWREQNHRQQRTQNVQSAFPGGKRMNQQIHDGFGGGTAIGEFRHEALRKNREQILPRYALAAGSSGGRMTIAAGMSVPIPINPAIPVGTSGIVVIIVAIIEAIASA